MAGKNSTPVESKDVETFAKEIAKAPKDWGQKEWREYYSQEPTVKVFISRNPGEHKDAAEFICLNGCGNYFKKGEYVDLPKSFADVYMASANQTEGSSMVDSPSGSTRETNLSKNEGTLERLTK